MKTCKQIYGKRLVAIVRKRDVGKMFLKRSGRVTYIGDVMGHVLPNDIGKCVVRSGDVLQVENDSQFRTRRGR